ncbi:FAD-dependent monooxygenase [Owenweeksia hongkongensis]|uniref:FAD-dependent monooxygenase n=1 Tax=Owenweeksia hongkongensis TaxID=253245 RepID=UPI003A8E27C6
MDIAIVGGGITGLTTALALNKLGTCCGVYERAPKLNEVGAGIWLQPNAMKVMDWIGIGDSLREVGMPVAKAEITNPQLIPIRKSTQGMITDPNGNSIIAIHRARLQQILFDALPSDTVQLGMDYQKHEEVNGKVKIHFSESEKNCDILLAGDGLNSRVRKQLFPNSETRYSGQTSWRGVVKTILPKGLEGAGYEAWGKGIRFGLSQISPNEVYWFAVCNAPQNQQDNRGTLKADLKKMFDGFHPFVKELIQETPLEQIIRTDISDLKRLPKWHSKNVCLIGDAAHATTPNMGQGACQGVEDAYYISNILAQESDAAAAFERFESERRRKVDFVVNNSYRFGSMAHSGLGQMLMKTIMKLTPEKVMVKQMNSLYNLTPSYH